MKTYSALRIFIASPGDLNMERNIFVDVLLEVNTIKAHSLGYHLEPVGWEETLPGVGRPQSLINKDLITCDLFVLLLWERWGTESGKYSSGTEEEYYLALEHNEKYNKPEIWLFFKNTISEVNEDINKITTFRKKIEEEKKLFYKSFSESMDWGNLFRKLMCNWLDNLGKNGDVDPNTDLKLYEEIKPGVLTIGKPMYSDGYLRLSQNIPCNTKKVTPVITLIEPSMEYHNGRMFIKISEKDIKYTVMYLKTYVKIEFQYSGSDSLVINNLRYNGGRISLLKLVLNCRKRV